MTLNPDPEGSPVRTHHTRSDSTARLAPAGVLAAAIAAVAGLATTSPALADWQFETLADERVRQVEVEFETDCLFWDLCWSRDKDDHRERVAQAIADEMDDPQALYVISMPQLPRHWEPVGRGRLVGMDGRTINRGRLRNFIRVYESVTDRALVAIMDHLDEMRPGAVFSFEDFRLTTNEHNPYPAYVQYDEQADFIAQIVGDDEAPSDPDGDYDEWLDDREFHDDRSVLFNAATGWMLADAHGIVSALDEEPDGDVYVAWDLPDPDENYGGGTASNPESHRPNREGGLTTVGRALAMGRDVGFESPVDPPPGGGGGGGFNPSDDGGSGDEPSGGDQGGDETGGDDGGEPGDDTDLGASLRVLQGGEGWNGATDGNAAGAIVGGDGPKPIARWDVVPYQDFTGRFEIGVVAFHIDGIERVSFSVDNGPWVHVEDMVLNPRTGVVEYAVALEAAAFDDGPVEVRAIVVPTEGPARVLGGPHDMSQDDVRIRGEHSLFLNANAGGTLQQPVRWVSPAGSDSSGDGSEPNPFRSIAQAAADIQDDFGSAEGGTVYLREGEYDYGQTSFRSIPETRWRWLTIAGAPDADREDVRIVSASGNGLRTQLVRFKNLTIHGASPAASSDQPRVWTDGVIMQGDGPLDGVTLIRGASWDGGYYATGSVYRNMQRGVREAQLVRDVEIYNLGADAFREMRGMAVNVEVRDLLNLDGTHNDVMQFYSNAGSDPFENVILYNFKAVENIAGQAFFMRSATDQRDFAIVNYLVASTGGGGGQWADNADHVLFWNYQQLRNGFIIRDSREDEPTTVTNLSIRDSVFEMFRMSHTGSWPTMSDQSWAENNHYIDMETFATIAPGVGATTGGSYETLFVDAANDDFRPNVGSILTRRDTEVTIPADLDGQERGTPGAIGALTEPDSN